MVQVPGTFLTILQALGFKADRDRGVRMLQTVHEHGGVRSPIAALVLLANYLFIPRALTDVKALLGHAGPVIRSSMVKYPYVAGQQGKLRSCEESYGRPSQAALVRGSCVSNGTLFLMMASHYARKTGEVDDAIPYLMRAIDECDRLHLAPNVYWNELGLCHFMKLDWPRAAEVFERLVFSGDKEFEFKAFVALQLRCGAASTRLDRAYMYFALTNRVLRPPSALLRTQCVLHRHEPEHRRDGAHCPDSLVHDQQGARPPPLRLRCNGGH